MTPAPGLTDFISITAPDVTAGKHSSLLPRMAFRSIPGLTRQQRHSSIPMRAHLSRRFFLRSSAACIALPFLDSLGFRRYAAATPIPIRPKRMAFLAFGWGVTRETWFPDQKQAGADFKLPPGLQPLEKHRRDLTILQNCTNKFSNEAHWGSTFWLTGANRYAEPGQGFSNTVSVDQVAAAHLGADTRFASLQLGTPDAADQGHGPGLSLAWDARGKPVAGLDNPAALFRRLFSAETVTLPELQQQLARKRSVLDLLTGELRHLKRQLSAADASKVEEYAQSIRDIETRLAKEERWMLIPKAKAPVDSPREGLSGREEITVMYDLMIAALRTDSTRILTYRQPVNSLLRDLDISYTGHDLSHYEPSQGDRMEFSQKRDAAQSALLAGLIDNLKAVREPDGSSLFDHTILTYGSNISSVHFLNNCPTILTGGGAGIRLGQHMVLPKDTPLCNVWLTLLQGLGVPVERHGDSTGIVPSLRA
jgi:hypothetical protein